MAYMLDLQQLYFGRDGSEYGGSLKSMDESDTMEENNVFDGDTAERVGKGDGHEENDAMDL